MLEAGARLPNVVSVCARVREERYREITTFFHGQTSFIARICEVAQPTRVYSIYSTDGGRVFMNKFRKLACMAVAFVLTTSFGLLLTMHFYIRPRDRPKPKM
jgi:hypothetical protein